MRNYKKYRSTVISLFQSFLAGKIDKTDFLFSLSEIETKLKGDVISKKDFGLNSLKEIQEQQQFGIYTLT